ncbi:lysylphosphatidylglycerol synthase transmembrane domain-containing protein [Methylobrevis albus]|uniref:UPF0104 family protein n=1 Tax=Methylobrevis albus TaxID=2793297 RepID=A0A931I3F4_9HYPH|nr:YbhN family protein [Methylobrevis albus]MBH0238561.1 UPF0104 family protein [Methylobrevis albus]
MKVMDYVWPIVGLGAVVLSGWLLYHELRGISFGDVLDSLSAITVLDWTLAAAGAFIAYAALAWYDRIALMHLGRRISWVFISLCSFTTYALSHNIGASVLSGAVIRYRAYTSRGLSAAEVGVLVAFCSFTFALGTVLLAGFVLALQPDLIGRVFDGAAPELSYVISAVLLLLVAGYVFGSLRGFRPLRLGGFAVHYPKPQIVFRQLFVAPVELIGAAAIIYFALPNHESLTFLTVLGVFLLSFSVALLSHAPGGLGVLEVVFVTALPEIDQADVLAALIVFRLLYLLIPFALSLIVVVAFERSRLAQLMSRRVSGEPR